MITVNIRKQGGAAVITIPSDVLKILNLDIGSTLRLDISNEGFAAHPIREVHQRYTLDELLKGITTQDIRAINEETGWFREGKPVGREML